MSSLKSAASALVTVFLAVSLQAQSTTYPYISVTPAAPVADRDSVTVDLALGQASNSCMAPTFTGMTFSLATLPTGSLVPSFTVTVAYTTVPVPPDRMCPMIYAPVDYGPSFALGKCALGTYAVIDQTTGKRAGSFSVVNVLPVSHDTVTVSPQKPTVKDSLHFDLFNASLDCCTQYYQKNVSVVNDSAIFLSYQYQENPACACLVAGSHTSFDCGPQKAGTYAIYKAAGIYCPPGQICPVGVLAPVRVGEVTVSGTTGVSFRRAVQQQNLGKTCETGLLYDLRGVRIAGGKITAASAGNRIVLVKEGRLLIRRLSVR